ncbi:glycosyltransferase family 4 protein [Knoellia locipacati]|uniref:Glycosyl transferase family 1 n=1 Tax=Knoellia locipacati TaxID=882824 RepID=A0A512SYP9_9MICO|nr:glycosyltransferase [Knoellia locipacati]GEQ13066.1 glycosyl transferase family 1 [Knoellia locipacati]
MRIAMLATSRNPIVEPYAGGQESHTAMLARGLRRLGHHVRLYARAGTDPELCDELVPYVDLPALSEVAAMDHQLPEPDFLRDHAAFTGAVADLLTRGDVDVVHNQSLHFLPLAFSAALTVPVVTTLHTPPFPWMEVGVALAGPGSSYVCVSRANAGLWTSLPKAPRIIHNGVDDDGRGPGPGGRSLVWTGRLTPEKGADLAIRTARRAGLPLRLAGPVSDPAWFDDVVAPELGRDVEHVGHLSHAELADLVRESAVTLVTPRWDEPFGLVAAESAMWGTPVVALDRGGLGEFVTPDIGVLVGPEGDDEAVVGALADAVPVAAALPRAQVHAAARAALGSDRMVEDYVGVYRDLVIRQGALT